MFLEQQQQQKNPAKDLANYEIQEPIALDRELEERSIWSLNNAKRKGAPLVAAPASTQQQTTDLFSSFSYLMKPGNESWHQFAKNGIKRIKMLRHPNILIYQDGIENDKCIYIVTERVQPLYNYLRESKDNDSQKENEIAWGLYQIATALNFLNNDCKLVHNNVCMSSIVINRAGEWKLTGFEYTHAIDDMQPPYKVLNNLSCYDPPEKSPVANLKPSRNSNAVPTESAVDSWSFGCLIWEIFNGLLPNMNSLKNPGKIPKRLVPAFCELVNAQPNKRLSPAKFLTVCQQSGGFMNNDFIETLLFLENIQIKDQAEKTKFFTDLTQKLDDFPHQYSKFKILPQLLNAYEFGNAGSAVLAPLFKLGKLLEENEYQKKIIPVVVKLFSSTDRATRMRLLQQLNLFVEHLSATIINDQIFPNICQGFSDTNPAIRESTIRSVVLLAPKLNYNNMNVELMKHFARLQGQDDQGMIRTNTTVCIGKIAPFINPQLRQRILLSAFPKAMRDPFPLSRLSGIVAFANTDNFYTLRDIASKVLPSLCMLTIDPEKDVRDEAFKTIAKFVQKLEKVSEQPALALEFEKDVSSCSLDLKNETSWTSWAMTGLSAKMTGYKNKTQQPSVALSTQPLGPPPSMTSPVSPNQSVANVNKELTPEKVTSKPKDEIKTSNYSKPEKIVEKTTNNYDSGWNMDDNQWKDLDGDEDMEPLEPLEPTVIKPNLSTKNTQNSSTTQNTDWSSWTNSFEDTTNNNNEDDDFSNFGFSNKTNIKTSKPQIKSNEEVLKPASSYNWSTQSTNNSSFNKEEDMFSSLVKDISINNNKPSTPKQESGWNDEWSDVFDNKSKDKKRTDNENKPKQSKPLKLGQKKFDSPF